MVTILVNYREEKKFKKKNEKKSNPPQEKLKVFAFIFLFRNLV